MINAELINSNFWTIDTYYRGFDKFNKFFNENENLLNSNEVVTLQIGNFEYPSSIDPEQEFVKFISDHVALEIPSIKITNISKSWFVHYPPNYTNEAHKHHQGRHFTAVLYLTDIETKSIDQVNGGSLWTFHLEKNKIIHQLYSYSAGKVVLMGGNVWHGTYPTHSIRKVFVCDFEYELNGV